MSKRWKEAERRVARRFQSRRTPLSGGNSGHTRADTLHDKLFIEVKQRKQHAVWTLFDEVKQLARKEGKVPLIALDRVRSPGCLFVVHSDDLEEFAKLVLSSQEVADELRNQKE